MDIKISKEKLGLLIDVVVDGLGIDMYDSFQSRTISTRYIEFLTPETREYVISRYYPDMNLVIVNDEKFYDLIRKFVGSRKFYDLIKDNVIKRIFKVYSDRFKTRNYGDIRTIKYVSDEQFNKK